MALRARVGAAAGAPAAGGAGRERHWLTAPHGRPNPPVHAQLLGLTHPVTYPTRTEQRVNWLSQPGLPAAWRRRNRRGSTCRLKPHLLSDALTGTFMGGRACGRPSACIHAACSAASLAVAAPGAPVACSSAGARKRAPAPPRAASRNGSAACTRAANASGTSARYLRRAARTLLGWPAFSPGSDP